MTSIEHYTKPENLIISDLKWKYLVWAITKGKNVLLIGPTRCGKTSAVYSTVKAVGKEDKFFRFNLGSTQDARAMLIGNTFAKKDKGTVFFPSQFVKAITTPGAVILLDELTRGHHDAWNILMSVVDNTQRYLRLDESENSEVVQVAEGVVFFATANIGIKFTSTRVLDQAMFARFPVKIEMEPLTISEEISLLKYHHPDANESQLKLFDSICSIAEHTREITKKEDSKISSFISTGSIIEMAELVMDGFTLEEIAQVSIYPDYPTDGDIDSERTYMKMVVQKYINPDETNSPLIDPTGDDRSDVDVNPDDVPF